MDNKILILGKVPPPIGGVTIHVSRSLQLLNRYNIEYYFYDLNKFSLISLLKVIFQYKNIHLHSSSNVLFRFFISFICYLLNRNLLLTIHGNWGEHNNFIKILDTLSIYFAKYPILLNTLSLKRAKRINVRSRQISSFFPPQNTQNVSLSSEIINRINFDKKHSRIIFSTNAFNLSFDSSGKEIYGITDLVKTFSEFSNHVLYISDPSGNYLKYIEQEKINITENIFIINKPHDYFELLKYVNCMIRNTTTDGDSISIKEALFLGKVVLATNIVNRHSAVYTYTSNSELKELITKFNELKNNRIENLSAENDLIKLYRSLFN